MDARVSIGLRPEFSARAMGTESSASAKARIAYCSRPGLCLNLAFSNKKKISPKFKYLNCGFLNG